MKIKNKIVLKNVKRKCVLDAEVAKLTSLYDKIDTSAIKYFKDFPLSSLTLEGLTSAGYVEPTEIQRESLGLALRGIDILGAANTGCGKTLAFVIPILERLWRYKWSQLDGLGALVISPTRELALQTYEVLCKVGCKHDLSAALIIGGTDVQFQKERISRSNIIICTPGRILQHMDENPTFMCDNLQILVLDEADRILDMGFKDQLNAIVQNLPATRQTLLFSATQTKSVKDLARLSLKEPVYVSVHEHAEHSTPARLKQCYMVCEEQEKLDLLWSFVRSHLHCRTIIFFTNCKQVRFVYEAFRRLRPGITVLNLHGSMNQMKRVNVYEEFCNKKHAALFATDVAARGLDFPDVDWVYQFDCPQDSTEYIHRSGRTARYSKDGESLLILTPNQEKPMIEELASKKVPIQKINVNRKKIFTIRNKLEILCAKDTNFKLFAQRAFVAYMRSVVTMSNKKIFDVNHVNGEALAVSFGLVNAPRVRFLRKMNLSTDKQKTSSTAPNFSLNDEEDGADVDDLLTAKSSSSSGPLDEEHATTRNAASENNELSSKRAKRLTKPKLISKLLRKNIQLNNKLVFDGEDDSATKVIKENVATTNPVRFDLEKAKQRMQEADRIDRENYRLRIKAKHKEQRLAKKAKRQQDTVDSASDKDEHYQEGSGDDESVDLSWIPDFDRINNAQNEVKDDVDPDASQTPDLENAIKEPKKKKKKLNADSGLDDKKADEEFALALLDC